MMHVKLLYSAKMHPFIIIIISYRYKNMYYIPSKAMMYYSTSGSLGTYLAQNAKKSGVEQKRTLRTFSGLIADFLKSTNPNIMGIYSYTFDFDTFKNDTFKSVIFRYFDK